MLLRLVGSAPVLTIEAGHPDTENAVSTLNRIRRQAQKRGWWFNIDYNVVYQPQENKEIIVPPDVITMVLEDWNIIQRGLKLYDKYNQTYQFEANVIACRQVKSLEWDLVPEVMQEYMAYFAGIHFIRDELEDPSKQKELKESAMQALIDVKKLDLESGQYNAFRNPRIQAARAGVQPYQRNNKRFFGDPDV
jgi:hypothetical protein